MYCITVCRRVHPKIKVEDIIKDFSADSKFTSGIDR